MTWRNNDKSLAEISDLSLTITIGLNYATSQRFPTSNVEHTDLTGHTNSQGTGTMNHSMNSY